MSNSNDTNKLIAAVRPGAESGKWLDQATLGNLLAIKAVDIFDENLLDEAEKWLREAAKNDQETAEHFKNVWPKIKNEKLKMIRGL